MNLAHYCLLESGAIAAGPCSLPDQWRGHRGLKHMSDDTLAALGWVPVVDTADDAPAHGDAVLIVEADHVRRHRPAAAPVVPQEVTMRQARLALYSAGMLDAAQAVIDALPMPQRRQAQIEWEYALSVRRDHPLIALMIAQGLATEVEVDGLFVAAAGL